MRLPLKALMRSARRIEEEPTQPQACETCDSIYGHESWCPEPMHAHLDEWRARNAEAHQQNHP